MHREHHGFLYGFIAALSMAAIALFVKLSSSASVGTLVFARFVLGVPLALWLIRAKKIPIHTKAIFKNLTRSIGSLLALYTYYYAVQHIPLVNAVTLVNTAPLYMPLLVLIWLKLLVSKKRFLAVALGFVGVVILLRPADNFLGIGSIVGLFSGLFSAIGLLSVRILSKTDSTESILSYYFLLGALLSLPPMLFDWRPIAEPIQWLYVFLCSIFALIFQFTITKAYTHAPATKVGTMSYLAVVFGGLFGWWFFGEVPDVWVLVGTLFIVIGAILALLDQTPPRPLHHK